MFYLEDFVHYSNKTLVSVFTMLYSDQVSAGPLSVFVSEMSGTDGEMFNQTSTGETRLSITWEQDAFQLKPITYCT